MNREILINSDGGETRVAVLEDGRLVEITVERPEAERVAGNVYKARVENVLPGMQAAFVDIGLEKNAFLYVADAAPVVNLDEVEGDAPPKVRKGLAINKLLKPGQKVTVQVTKDPIGTKGARVSAYVTLPSHYIVLMPTVDFIGVSRRISDAKERARLRAMAGKLKPRGMGLIVRTAADGHEFEEIEADVKYLLSLWRKIQTRGKSGTAPRVLHQDLGLVGRVVRDVLNESVSRLVVDSGDEYSRVKDLLEAVAPALKDRIELHDRSLGELFAVQGVEAELDRAVSRRVWLKSGGYLVIDETEAFTVFDVNTGRYVGSTSLAQTVLDTNLEAAMEIARQLRLRDIGGIIIIDFIDMESAEHRQRVLSRFEEHLGRDRTRSHVLGLTELGLLEMTRKKVRQSLGDTLTKICPACEGRGRVLSEETAAARVRREIRELLRASDAKALLAEIHPSVAALLIGTGGAKLRELERELAKTIYVRGSDELAVEGFKFRLFDSQAEVQAAASPVHAGDVIELRVEEQHVSNRRDGVARIDGFVLDIEDGGDRVGERVKIEVTKVHRTFARAKIVSPAKAPSRPQAEQQAKKQPQEQPKQRDPQKRAKAQEQAERAAAQQDESGKQTKADDAAEAVVVNGEDNKPAPTEEPAPAKRKSRRRRRAKSTQAKAEQPAVKDQEAPGEGQAAPEGTKPKADDGAEPPAVKGEEGKSASTEEPAPAKRKSRRRRSRRKKAAVPAGEGVEGAAAASEQPREVAPETPRSAPDAAPEASGAAAKEAEQPRGAPGDEQEAEAKAPAKPKRKPRRPRSSKAAAKPPATEQPAGEVAPESR